MKAPLLSFLTTAILWCASSLPVRAQTYSVTDLGALNGAATYATAINDNGVISGYAQPDANSARAWIWKNGVGFTDVGSFGGADNRGLALGASDTLIGYSQNTAGVERGFRWDGTALTDLGSIAAGDAVFPQSVNAGGAVAGYTNTGGGTFGFKLEGGTMTALGVLPGAGAAATSAAYDINDAGQIVGVASWLAGGTRAFRTDAGGALVSLGTLGANDSFAQAINADGQIVGFSVNAGNETHAFLFNEGSGMRDLGVFSGGHDSRAYGIDDAGDVVGSATNAAGQARAFLWTPGPNALHDLNDLIPPNSGWVLEEARDINNGGDIVGVGVINGQEHAFLLEAYTGPDTAPPVAVATAGASGQGASSFQVTVKFWDNEKVVSATARAPGAIRVTGPNNYDAPGTAVSWTTNDSQVVNVTFNVTPPGGTWDPSDNGSYEIRVASNQVSDLAGNRMPGSVIGAFSVGLQTAPTFNISGLPTTGMIGMPVSLTVAAVSSYPNAPTDVFTYMIDWDGDGSDIQTIDGVSGSMIPHTYTSLGTHIVRAHCTDPHGVVSSERTGQIAVGNAPLGLIAETLDTQIGYYSTMNAVAAAVKGGTMYFFGGNPLVGADLDSPIVTWNYATPGAQFTFAGSFTIGPIFFEGAAVDGRQRVIVWGGYSTDTDAGFAPVASARSYTPAGGSGSSSVAAMPSARLGAVTARDAAGRIYSLTGGAGTNYRYTAGTAAAVASAWSVLPDPPSTFTPSTACFDGGSRVIIWTASSVWALDINTNAWTQLPNPPVASPKAAVLGADGFIYLFSGTAVWTFDPVTNIAGQLGAMAFSHDGLRALLGTDGYVYLPGANDLANAGAIERIDTNPGVLGLPRISSVPTGTTVVQGNPWTYQIAASGKPRPTFSVTRGPAGLGVDATTGLVSWTPTLAQVGAQTAVVRASNSTGFVEQLISFNVLAVPPDLTPPTAPTNIVVANIGLTSADIAWTASTDNLAVTGYNIYQKHSVYRGRGSTYRVVYSVIGTTIGTSFHFANLPAGSTRLYYVAAFDAAGNVSTRTPVTFTLQSPPVIYTDSTGTFGGRIAIVGEPFTSSVFTAAGNPLPTLTPVGLPAGAVWHATAGNTGYFTWTPVAGQEGDTTFTITAASVSGNASQDYSLHVYPAGTDLIPPAPVAGVVVDQVTSDSCRVTWAPTTDNYGVVTYRATAAHRAPRSRFHHGPYDDHIVTVDLPVGATQTTLTGLRPSTSYAVTVIASDAAGLWSYAWSGSGTTVYTRPAPFAVPNVAQTTNADGSLTMTWPGQGYYWLFTVQCTDTLNPPNWQPAQPATQWPSFATSFTFAPDPNAGQRFYRVLATPTP